MDSGAQWDFLEATVFWYLNWNTQMLNLWPIYLQNRVVLGVFM